VVLWPGSSTASKAAVRGGELYGLEELEKKLLGDVAKISKYYGCPPVSGPPDC
jgi:hypothetical protein